MTFREIGQELDMSTEAVRNAYFSGLRKLRQSPEFKKLAGHLIIKTPYERDVERQREKRPPKPPFIRGNCQHCHRPARSAKSGLCDSHYRQARSGKEIRPIRKWTNRKAERA